MISKRAKGLSPYVAGEQPRESGLIKLNTNENPYGAGEMVLRAVREFDCDKLRLYPDPDSAVLRRLLAEKEGVGEENIFVGNGSDEVLAFAFYALFDGNVVFPDITYSFYPVYCNLYGLSYKTVPLNADFTVNPAALIDKDYGGVVLANPNAPTSLLLEKTAVEKIIAQNKCNVIIDEAYIDFAPENSSVASLCKSYANLLTIKTFSKSYSLAGIRCGYAVGSKELIDALSNVKNSFNSYPVDALCQAACAAAVSDTDYHNACCKNIIATRNKTASALTALGFTVLPSAANFLYAAPPAKKTNETNGDGVVCCSENGESTNGDGVVCCCENGELTNGKAYYDYLRQNKILVRYFSKPARIQNFVRISIGTEKEMDTLIEVSKMFSLL